jgi:O-antigen/teichoic acid export membrane protein
MVFCTRRMTDPTDMADQPGSLLSGLGRNFVYATISAGSAVLLLGVLVLTGRLLGHDVYGQFSFALALATIGEGLMDFGLHQVGIRAVARDAQKAADVFRNSVALKFLPGALMVVVIALLARWLRSEADFRWACVLLAISAVMRSYLLTIRGVLMGLEEFAMDAAVVLLDRILLLAVSAVILLTGGGLVALCWGFVAARAFALAGSLGIARRRFSPLSPAFDQEMWSDLRRSAFALGTFLVMLNLYSYIDTVLLGILSTDTETGLYNAAYRVYEGLTYAPAILSAVLTPRLSREYVTDRGRHRMLARNGLLASLVLAACVAVVTWFVGGWVISLLFGSAFRPATRALQILSSGLLVVYPIWILQSIAMSVSAERILLRTTVIGSVVNIAANLVLIPSYGRDGSAVATVIGEAVSLLLLLSGVALPLWKGADEQTHG